MLGHADTYYITSFCDTRVLILNVCWSLNGLGLFFCALVCVCVCVCVFLYMLQSEDQDILSQSEDILGK